MLAEVLSLLFLFYFVDLTFQVHVTEAKAADDVSSAPQNDLLSLIVGSDKGKY